MLILNIWSGNEMEEFLIPLYSYRDGDKRDYIDVSYLNGCIIFVEGTYYKDDNMMIAMA